MASDAPSARWCVLAPVVLALLFDLAVAVPGPPGDGHLGLGAARFRLLPWALGQVLPEWCQDAAVVVLHAACTALVFLVLRLAAGSDAAALFAAALWAVSPAHRRAAAGGDGLAIALGAAFALAAIALALSPRPRRGPSAALYAAALLSHPVAVAAVVPIGLARGVLPAAHLLALALVAALRLLVLGRGAVYAVAAQEAAPERWLRGLGRAFDDVLPLGPATAVAILALALAVAVARGPALRQTSVWCAALLAFSLPWTVVLGEESRPAPGSALLATLPLVALAAEGGRRLRLGELPAVVANVLEASVLAAFAVLALLPLPPAPPREPYLPRWQVIGRLSPPPPGRDLRLTARQPPADA